MYMFLCLFFFFKQKTAYEMRISDWSSDVCSSDLKIVFRDGTVSGGGKALPFADLVHKAYLARVPLWASGFYATPDIHFDRAAGGGNRSEEGRVGKECVSTCRSRWSPYDDKKKEEHTSEHRMTITMSES